MKLSEKIITAILTISFGVLLIGLRSNMISVVMTIFGISLVVVGVMDFVNKNNVQGWVKLICGLLAIVLGWVIVGVVLYILAALLVVAGAVELYHEIKWGFRCKWDLETTLLFAKPVLCLAIGVLLFFSGFDWIFVIAGIMTILLGCVLLIDGLRNE